MIVLLLQELIFLLQLLVLAQINAVRAAHGLHLQLGFEAHDLFGVDVALVHVLLLFKLHFAQPLFQRADLD